MRPRALGSRLNQPLRAGGETLSPHRVCRCPTTHPSHVSATRAPRRPHVGSAAHINMAACLAPAPWQQAQGLSRARPVTSRGATWRTQRPVAARARHAGQVHRETSWEEDAAPTPGSSIRVYHQTYIDISRSQFWQLLREMVPEGQWARTAVVLASLESIYRAEFSKLSEETCAALTAADSAEPQEDEALEPLLRKPFAQVVRQAIRRAAQRVVWSFSSNSAKARAKRQPGMVMQSQADLDEGEASGSSSGESQLGDNGGELGFEAGRSGNSTAALPTDASEAGGAAPAARVAEGSIPGRPARPGQDWDDEKPSTVDKLDRRFLSLLAVLVHLSHFWQLTRRDAEIAKSLNADYLSQLFILGSARRLDADVVEAFYEASVQAQEHAGAARLASLDDSTASLWHNQQVQAHSQDTQPTHSQPNLQLQEQGWGAHHTASDGRATGARLGGGGSGAQNSPPPGGQGTWLSRPPVSANDDPPPEARGMLIFKRGHALEVQRGQLLLAKLDLAQIQLVRSVARFIGSNARSAWSGFLGWARQLPASAASAVATIAPTSGELVEQQVQLEEGRIVGQGEQQEGPSMVKGELREERAQQAAGGTREQQQQDGMAGGGESPGQRQQPHVQKVADPNSSSDSGNHGSSSNGSSSSSSSSAGSDPQAAVDRTLLFASEPVEERSSSTTVSYAVVGEQHEDGSAQDQGSVATVTFATDADVRWLQELLLQAGPRITEAMKSLRASGTAMIAALSEWGLVPRLDVMPLNAVERTYPVQEPPRLPAKYIHKVALSDVIGADLLCAGPQSFARVLLQEVTLVEPAYREVLVLYRNTRQDKSRRSPGPAASELRWTAPLRLPALRRQQHDSQNKVEGKSEGQEQGQTALTSPAEAGSLLRKPHSSSAGAANHNGSSGHREGVHAYNSGLHLERSGSRSRRSMFSDVVSEVAGSASSSNGVPAKSPIQLLVYRDIPLPDWKLVLPDKLLQFRPLDLVRADIFALAGLGAVLANARYDSIILEVVTLVSGGAFLVRVVLGFQRMAERYRSYVNEVLQQRTVASGEGAIEFLANSAALQQFKQASLAYLLLLNHQQQQQQQQRQGEQLQGDAEPSPPAPGMTITQIAQEAEHLLRQTAQLQVRFDADEAVAELLRLGLARVVQPAPAAGDGSELTEGGSQGLTRVEGRDGTASQQLAGRYAGKAAAAAVAADTSLKPAASRVLTLVSAEAVAGAEAGAGVEAGAGAATLNKGAGGQEHVADGHGRQEVRLEACLVSEAVSSLQTRWDALLWSRVDSILREFD